MGQSFLITTVTSAWEAPTWTRRVGGLKSWCPVQTADALVSVALPAPVPVDQQLFPARLCRLPWGGGWGGEVGGGDDFKYRGVFRSLDIFLLWISRNHASGAREKGRETFWSCVWPFPKVDIPLCVLLWDMWGHLETQAALSCIGCCTCSTKLRLFCGSAWAHWKVRKHDYWGSSYILSCGSQRPLRCSVVASISHPLAAHPIFSCGTKKETLIEEGDKRAVFLGLIWSWLVLFWNFHF